MNTVDNNGAWVTKSVLDFSKELMISDDNALAKADYAIMHPVQFLACVEATPIKEITKAPDAAKYEGYSTLLGVKIIQDPLFAEGVIEFRTKDHEVLLRLQNLAVPQETK